jgi:valyl-tRNA synthetase
MNLSKTYEPNQYESTIYDLWEQSGAFKPEGKGKPYSIVLPPPNANAGLHIGHTLMFAIQDTLIRYHRMKGDKVLWAPGADHAGFETQVVYEKHLAKEGKSRFDFTREELFSQIYNFVGQNKESFEKIFRTLGASVDWSRFTFTLDDAVVETAYSTFKKMWDDGLVYRGERLVNYCTQHRTGFADIEVDYQEKESPLYYLKYGPFELATTRPETKFGDTAVAVHPEDERYKDLVGKVLEVEGVNGPFEIRVIADEMVDRNFGTGVVKITPAHDFNDWEAGQRHNLEAIRVINHDGTMNHRAGKYEGMTVLEAREAVVKALDEKGLLVKIDKHYKNRVGTCYKCGTIIEPMLMDQWFISMEKLTAPAISALQNNEITFYPENKKDQVISYLQSVKDWNISRQIAWGIPIPAFQNVNDPDDWIFNTTVTEEVIEVNNQHYRRDPDVFDTWFSSGHWPFVTMGYPDSEDFKEFYPNSVMETGQDILYPWVSRMICIGLYITGEVPFKVVYLHGMVRAEDGRKMSKSLGNVIDPTAELEQYGADAIRMGMMAGRSAGYSAAYAPGKVLAGRNFCNKLWNISRFTETALGESYSREKPSPASSADHWILQRTNDVITDVTQLIEDYRFSEAFDKIYHFVWDDFADWYIEASKAQLNKSVLSFVLETSLKLAHPFAPFVTETIWQTLTWKDEELLIRASWPVVVKADKKIADEFSDIKNIVSEIRYISAALEVKTPSLYFTNNAFLKNNADIIKRFARLARVGEVESGRGLHLTTTKHDCWLDIDLHTAKIYVTKLRVAQEEKTALIERLEQRLQNKGYTDKAPKEVVQQTKDQLAHEQELLEKLHKELATFESLSQS